MISRSRRARFEAIRRRFEGVFLIFWADLGTLRKPGAGNGPSAQQLRNEGRKRQRLLEKARRISDELLARILVESGSRLRAKAAATAAAKAFVGEFRCRLPVWTRSPNV